LKDRKESKMSWLGERKVLVTGAHGFLGRNVVKELEDQGCHNILAPTHKELDLLDRSKISQFFQDSTTPNIIIHLAAIVGGIGANQKYPGDFLYENLQMGINLIDETLELKNTLENFLLIGTICSYPKFTPVPFKETDLWNGYPEETNAPYGIAKKTLIEMGRAYHKQYGFPFTCLMPVNLYGPGDNFDPEFSHVIPAMIKRLIEAKEGNIKEVTMWGTGKATREFLFVEDAANGIVDYLPISDPNPTNIGTGKEISISKLAELVAWCVDYKGIISWDSTKPDGQPRRCLDVSRIRRLIGWESKTPFETGLRKTVDWYLREGRKNATQEKT
jgi:GDP-L-fucose synthase